MRAVATLAAIVLALSVAPAAAHHPGERIDEVMAEREPAFEATDLRRIPALNLMVAGGDTLALSDLENKIVVLSFMPADCAAPCEAQQALLRRVQEGVNVSPMRDQVMFLTVGTAAATGWDKTNWQPVTAGQGAAKAADRFAGVSERDSAAPLVHVIARGGRHAGIFHGADFGHVNLILYISELVNAPPREPGLLDRMFGAFE